VPTIRVGKPDEEVTALNATTVQNWLQIVGNFGLVVGLILVAVQIKQSTDLAEAQMLNEGWLAQIQRSMDIVGENGSAALARAWTEPETLTPEDVVVLDSLMTSWWFGALRLENLASRGYEVFPLEAYGNMVPYELGNAFAIAWWNGDHRFSDGAPRARAAIEERLEQLGRLARTANLRRYETLREALSEK
jgi:hypothetical protein